MKIVVLGAGGRLGAALARTWSPEDEIFPFAHADLDLARPGEIERILGPLGFDALVNCAALTNVDYCETHEAEAMRINAEAVGEIGALCARKKARCLHIGTDYVFDGESRRPYIGRRTRRAPSASTANRSCGARRHSSTPPPAHLVARVSWVFGPDRPSFIDGIIKRALESDSAEAIGDKWSTPCFTIDLAKALHPFLRDIPQAGILHATNTGECTWRDYGQYALECAARAGLPVKTTEVKPIPLAGMKTFVARRPVYTVLSTRKTRHPHRLLSTPLAAGRRGICNPVCSVESRLK